MSPSEDKAKLMVYESRLNDQIDMLDRMLADFSTPSRHPGDGINGPAFELYETYWRNLEEAKRTAIILRNAISKKLKGME